MIDSEILEKLQGFSIEDRIGIVEAICRSLKNDLKENELSQADVVSPVLSKNTSEEALAIFNSMYVEIPESERERKDQELMELLRKWREEDINE